MDEVEIKTEFNYTLTTQFKYADGTGEQVPAKFITFYAPTRKCIKECSALKQAFFRAMNEQDTSKATGETEVEIESKDIMALLAISNKVDLPDVMEVAAQLFLLPGIALVDGEHKFKTALMDRVSVDDFENMLGEYLLNFTLASSLAQLKEKSHKESSA